MMSDEQRFELTRTEMIQSLHSKCIHLLADFITWGLNGSQAAGDWQFNVLVITKTSSTRLTERSAG